MNKLTIKILTVWLVWIVLFTSVYLLDTYIISIPIYLALATGWLVGYVLGGIYGAN